MENCWYHVCTIWYIWGFHWFSPHDLTSAIGFYNDTLADNVEKQAPKKSRVVTVRADKPSYTAELSAEKRLRRNCERKYENTQLESDKLLLKEQRNKYNNLLNSTKKDYIKNTIENAQSSKDLYKICDKLFNRAQRSVLPSHDWATSFADTFVELIRSNLEESLNTSTDQLPSTAPYFMDYLLNSLELFPNLMSGK